MRCFYVWCVCFFFHWKERTDLELGMSLKTKNSSWSPVRKGFVNFRLYPRNRYLKFTGSVLILVGSVWKSKNASERHWRITISAIQEEHLHLLCSLWRAAFHQVQERVIFRPLFALYLLSTTKIGKCFFVFCSLTMLCFANQDSMNSRQC
jgi:hypothetical protein